jgi:hypothetical protein
MLHVVNDCVFGREGEAYYIESMNIHPTNGGVAPLYKPAKPSFRSVCMRQSTGPRNWDFSVVCRRTFMVSKG